MEWIKVKNRFNQKTGEHTSNVPYGQLLVSNGKSVRYVDDHGWRKGEYYFYDGQIGRLEDITHFMVLPPPPEE